MSGSYFSIFNSVKAKSPRQEITPSLRQEKETSTKLPCMICYKYELEFSSNDLNDDAYIEQSSNLFQNYASFLRVQLIPQMHWNFRSEILPFCKDCLMKVKTLTVLQNKLTFVMKQIKKSVLDMKIQILKSQNTKNLEDIHISCPDKDDTVEVEILCSSSSVLASKHQEKVDHFRSLVIKEFTPNIVLLRDDIMKITEDFHAKLSDANTCNLNTKNPKEDEVSFSDASNAVFFEGCNIGVVKSKYSNPSAEDLSLTISENIFEDNGAKDMYSVSDFKNEERYPHETEKILKELVIVHDVEETTYAEAQLKIRKIGGNGNWQCTLCKKRFLPRRGGHRGDYGRHIDRVHKNIKRFQCRLCPNYRSYERHHCNKHIKTAHANYLSKMIGNSSANLLEQVDSTEIVDANILERKLADSKPDKMSGNKLKKPDGQDGGDNDSMQKELKVGSNAIYRQFYTNTSNHYKCKFCASKIMFKCNLKRHFLNYHGPLDKFKCRHCERIFSSKYMHTRHMKADHKEVKGENNDDENQIIADKDIILLASKKTRPLRSNFINKTLSCGDELAVNKAVVDEDIIDKNTMRMEASSPTSLAGNSDSENMAISISTNSNIFEKSSPEPENLVNFLNVDEKNETWKSLESESKSKGNPSLTKIKADRRRTKVGKCDTRNHEYPPHIERGIINACGNNVVTNINEYFEDKSVEGNKVRCKVCSIVITKDKRHRHYVSVHNKATFRYKCKYCQKHFYYKSECALHIRVSHYMEKPFQCSQCTAAFTTINSRAIHMRKCYFLSSTNKCK